MSDVVYHKYGTFFICNKVEFFDFENLQNRIK